MLAFELDTFTELWRTAGRLEHYRVDDDYRDRKGAASHVETRATGLLADAKRAAAATLDRQAARLQAVADAGTLRRNPRAIMDTLLKAGAAGEYLDYASAEQAFMAVQMLAFELGDDRLQDELDRLAAALQDDERYRAARFARLLAR